MTTLPVFPLNAPLLPGCKMPLQIFEQRYLDMVSRCMRTGEEFCVALLQPGSERHEVIRPDLPQPVDTLPFYTVATTARIVDFGQRDNGLLAITIQGGQRVTLDNVHQTKSGLWMAGAQARAEQADLNIDHLEEWQELLQRLLDMSGLSALGIQGNAQSDESLINYLVTLLPLPAAVKQDLLETDSHALRWEKLEHALALIGAPEDRQTPS